MDDKILKNDITAEELQELKEELQKEIDSFNREKEKFDTRLKVEKRRIEQENALIDIKLKRLEMEFAEIASEKQFIKEEKERLKRAEMKSGTMNFSETGKLLFYGAFDEESLKKRYRDLIKIFHPDNTRGNNTASIIINYEYEKLKKIYGNYS